MKRSWFKKLNLLVSIAIIFQLIVPIGTVALNEQTPAQTVSSTVEYYRDSAYSQISGMWDIAAIYSAGENLSDGTWNVTMPSKPSGTLVTDYTSYILASLMLGQTPNLEMSALASMQNADTGEFPGTINAQVFAIIALDASGQGYDDVKAVNYLLSLQKSDGGFSISADADTGDADVTGMALIALSRHKDISGVRDAIDSAVSFLKTCQNAEGAFIGLYGENSSTTATVISGLCAVGEDVLSSEYIKKNGDPFDSLISYMSSDKGFGYDSSSVSNSMATAQALIALGDIVSGSSVFDRIEKPNDYPLVNISVQAGGESIAFCRGLAVSGSSPTALDALQQALQREGVSITAADGKPTSIAGQEGEWLLFVNGSYKDSFDGYTLSSSDDIVVQLSPGDEYTYASFKNVCESTTTQDGVTLTLSGALISDDKSGSAVSAPIAGADVKVNAENAGKTAQDGSIKLEFDNPGVYIVTAQKDMMTIPYCKIIVTGDPVTLTTRTVSVRIEGMTQTIANGVVCVSTRTAPTAQDAVEKLLDDNSIQYNILGSDWGAYISDINGEFSGSFGGWDGWMFAVNGAAASTGIDGYTLNDGDEILIYYGLFGTYIPQIEISPSVITSKDDISIHIGATYDDYPNGWDKPAVATSIDIAGAKIDIDAKQFTSDASGLVNIPSGTITAGSYTMEVSKQSPGSCQDIVRLEIPVTIYNDAQVSGSEVAVDEGSPPQYIDFDSASKIYVAAELNGGKAVLPAITAENKEVCLTLAKGTTAQGYSGWDGKILLPEEKSVTVSGKSIYAAYKIGSTSGDITLSSPARIVIKGAAGKKAGVIVNGSITEIATTMAEDKPEYLPDNVDRAKIDVGSDIVIWTRKFSTFAAYTSSTTQVPQPETVTLYVKGDSDKGVILPRTTIELEQGDNPYTILVRALPGLVETEGSAGSLYVSGIDGLYEFDKGPQSGWMYSINGEFLTRPATSALNTLSNGDSVSWRYTLDLGADLGDTNAAGAGAVAAANPDYAQTVETLNNVLSDINKKDTLDEFDIFALRRNGENDFNRYITSLESAAGSYAGNFRKSTDLSKLIIASYSAGLSPDNVGGYNLLDALYNFDKIENQGANASIYALIALDATAAQPLPGSKNTRESLISLILGNQNANGGISLAKGGESNVDITAMALYALAPYRERDDVKACIEKAVSYLSDLQQKDGGYAYDGAQSSESASQVIIALSTLKIDLFDSRFVKAEGGLISNLMSFKTDGGFAHIYGEGTNDMATYQAALALTAYKLSMEGKTLFDLSGYTIYNDISNAPWAQEAIISLTDSGVLNGTGKGSFKPDDLVSREEFAKMAVLAFNAYDKDATCTLCDVDKDQWYYTYIASAQAAGITTGNGEGFGVGQTLSRQDLCVMAARAAAKAGITLKNGQGLTFADSDSIAPYASQSITSLNESGIVNGTGEGKFSPQDGCTRAQAAAIIWRLLSLK